MNLDEDSYQEISNDDSKDTILYPEPADINDDSLDQQQVVLHLGQMWRGKTLPTTWVPLPMI
jgi:hypothetical protein